MVFSLSLLIPGALSQNDHYTALAVKKTWGYVECVLFLQNPRFETLVEDSFEVGRYIMFRQGSAKCSDPVRVMWHRNPAEAGSPSRLLRLRTSHKRTPVHPWQHSHLHNHQNIQPDALLNYTIWPERPPSTPALTCLIRRQLVDEFLTVLIGALKALHIEGNYFEAAGVPDKRSMNFRTP